MLDAVSSVAACPLRKESMCTPQGKQKLQWGSLAAATTTTPALHACERPNSTFPGEVREARGEPASSAKGDAQLAFPSAWQQYCSYVCDSA